MSSSIFLEFFKLFRKSTQENKKQTQKIASVWLRGGLTGKAYGKKCFGIMEEFSILIRDVIPQVYGFSTTHRMHWSESFICLYSELILRKEQKTNMKLQTIKKKDTESLKIKRLKGKKEKETLSGSYDRVTTEQVTLEDCIDMCEQHKINQTCKETESKALVSTRCVVISSLALAVMVRIVIIPFLRIWVC